MNSVGVVIVTYNPDLEVLRQNILAIREQVESCIIVDNGSTDIQALAQLAESSRVKLFKLGQNKGIAFAQNYGFEALIRQHLKWTLTLDQDSHTPADFVQQLLAKPEAGDPSVAILAPAYLDKAWSTAQKKALNAYETKPIKNALVISSGALVRNSAWQQVNGLDSFLFIDQVDYDFDQRLLMAGFEIWQYPDLVLQHQIGENLKRPVLQKLLLLKSTDVLADHSAFRQYYIYRNVMIFTKRYHHPNPVILMVKTIFATRRIFAYSQKRKKMGAALRGIVAGSKYHPEQDQWFQRFLSTVSK